MTPDDRQLMRALFLAGRNGDREARERWVRMALKPIFGHCRRMVGAGDAEEAANEVVETVILRQGEFPEDSDLYCWIVNLTHLRCLQRLRAGRRRAGDTTKSASGAQIDRRDRITVTEAAAVERLEPDSDAMVTLTSSPYDILTGRAGLLVALEAAIHRLPPTERVAVTLLSDDLTREDVSKVAGIPLGTVNRLIPRARELLRSILIGDPFRTADRSPSPEAGARPMFHLWRPTKGDA